VIIDEDAYFAHYGTPRHSGRYPWGSGGNSSMTNRDFLATVREMKSRGLKETEIVKGLQELGIDVESTSQLRAKITIANNAKKREDISTAVRLQEKGMSNVAIAEQMFGSKGKESTVRALLAENAQEKADILTTVSNTLKTRTDEVRFLDIGSGTEQLPPLGISPTKLKAAVALLKEEGYTTHTVPVPQLGTGKNTSVTVLCPPDTTWGEVMKNRDNIRQITDFSDDGGRTVYGIHPPLPIDPNRVAVKYKEDGGSEADGVIYVRPGVDDVSLGSSRYAQVRIQVGDGHYLKGMAVYKDDLPDGVDLMFNTNKSNTGNKLDAMKALSDDPNNPFGAVLKANGQQLRLNPDGTRTVTSVMNVVNEENDWSTWSKTLSTQMLSKQSPTLAKSQLDLTYEQRRREFEKIAALTNPAVRKSLLEKFGDETDTAAVQLDAAAINTRQGWHVILPVSSMPPTQVYAPRFRDGESVVLIRYPHAGTFEIPELTVNNNHPEAKRLLGKDAGDAVGIHHSVAERLSGADFDGDTVLVIPNGGSKRIKTTRALDQLKNFDPRTEFKGYEGMKKMSDREKKIEMGKVSNLITDMTLRGASADKIARAVKHSMVVIDAQKHDLNYKLSEQVHGIRALNEEFQGKKLGGASTLISLATSKERVPQREPRKQAQGGPIDKETGKRVFVETGAKDYRTGEPKFDEVERLANTDDAHALVSNISGTRMERIYADHSNRLKALANEARRISVNTPNPKRSPSAAKVYADEVRSLDAKLTLAIRNRPLERQAQVYANAIYKARLNDHPEMDEAMRKKVKSQALTGARLMTGATRREIEITPNEWDAIQAGAISNNKLTQILNKANIETVRKLATPRVETKMSTAMTNRAKVMLDSGYTRAEVADQLGVSLSTLDRSTSGEDE